MSHKHRVGICLGVTVLLHTWLLLVSYDNARSLNMNLQLVIRHKQGFVIKAWFLYFEHIHSFISLRPLIYLFLAILQHRLEGY